MRRLNKKHLAELRYLMRCGMSYHMTYHMQDDQDLYPGFRRRAYQQRARWRKAMAYFEDVLVKRARGEL